MFSKATLYAIQMLAYMASQKQNSQYFPVRKIGAELGLPVYFLSKIVKRLVRSGIVDTSRGIKGGMRFRKPPTQISLYDIIQAFEGDKRFVECILGLPQCEEFERCTFHKRYLKIREQLIRLFQKTSIAEIAKQWKRGAVQTKEENI